CIVTANQDQLARSLALLVDRHIVDAKAEGYAFTHDRVREALYGDIPDDERRELHQRCGELLERRHAASIERVLNVVARHFSRGRDRRKACYYLERAGDAAKANGA